MPRTLVRLPNWLGDIVMALPALRAMMGATRGDDLVVALPAAYAPLAPLVSGVSDVLPLASAGAWRGPAFEADVARVGQGGYARAVLFTNSFGSAWMLWRAGVPERWGYRTDWRGPLLTRATRPPRRPRTERHHAWYYAHLLARLGLAPSPPTLDPAAARLQLPDDLRERSQAWLEAEGIDVAQPLVGFAPGAAYGPAKRWSPIHVATVIARLAREHGAQAVLVGSAADRGTAAEVESAVRRAGGSGRPVVNAAGRTDVALLAGVLAACDAVVANDSGAMHVAAAVGTPVVAIFGPTDERATAPLGEHRIVAARVFCRPCHLRRCPIDHRCMRRVTPDHVVDAIRTWLGRSARCQ